MLAHKQTARYSKCHTNSIYIKHAHTIYNMVSNMGIKLTFAGKSLASSSVMVPERRAQVIEIIADQVF